MAHGVAGSLEISTASAVGASSKRLAPPTADAGRYLLNHLGQPLAHASGWIRQSDVTLLNHVQTEVAVTGHWGALRAMKKLASLDTNEQSLISESIVVYTPVASECLQSRKDKLAMKKLPSLLCSSLYFR